MEIDIQMSECVDQIFGAYIDLMPMLENLSRDRQGHGYKYADLAQLINETREPLLKCGLAITQFGAIVDGKNYLVTQLMHRSGQWMRGYYELEKAGMRGANDAQQMGAALTYARRYNMSAMLNIAQEDDDAAGVSRGSSQQPVSHQKQNQGGQSSKSDDDKPWYNDFEAQKQNIMAAISKGTTPQQAIAHLSKDYKVSKQIRDAIMAMGNQQ